MNRVDTLIPYICINHFNISLPSTPSSLITSLQALDALLSLTQALAGTVSRFVRSIGQCLSNYRPPHPTEKMETAASSINLINYYGTMWRHITEDGQQQPPLWEPHMSQQTGGAYNPLLQNQECVLLSRDWTVNEGFLSRKQNMWLTATHHVQEFGVRNRKIQLYYII